MYNKKKTELPEEPINFGYDEDAVSLLDILEILLKKKWLIIAFTIIIFGVVSASGILYYLNTPSYKESSLNFTLKFKNAEDFKYPNGSEFSEEDITLVPILQKVYDDLGLAGHFESFKKFAQSISIMRYNPKLAFLNYEFNSKLKDAKLTSSERYELEQEFYRQTNAAKLQPDYLLTFRYPENAKKYNISEALVSKVLYSILDEWLTEAKAERGVTSYNIRMVKSTANMMIVENADYFNGTDYLRKQLDELSEELKKIDELPNTHQIIVENDTREYTLRDIELGIEDIKTHLLNPLFYLIKKYSLTKDSYSTKIYIETQLSNLNLKLNVINRQREVAESMLMKHLSSGSSNIMELEKQEIHIKNEIAFYKDYLHTFVNRKLDSKPTSNELLKITKLQKSIVDQENILMRILYKFYKKASKVNLDRNSNFYNINTYSSHVFPKVKLSFVLKICIAVSLIFEALLFAIIIIGGLLKRKQREQQHMAHIPSGYYESRLQNLDGRTLRTLPENSDNVQARRTLPHEKK